MTPEQIAQAEYERRIATRENEVRLLREANDKSNEAPVDAVKTEEERDRLLLQLSEWSKTLNWMRNTHRCNGTAGPIPSDCSICNAIDEALLRKTENQERRGMVWRACPEHRQHEKVPFKWGPPPHHPCPNCEYRDITESRETGPETFIV
jgi:hypothetical protein